jgi:putative oxidoreductase
VTSKPSLINLGLLLARIPLGAFFLKVGLMKFQMGVSTFVEKSSDTVPHWLGMPLGRAYLHALPFAEVIVGGLLILGLLGRPIATIASLILISIIIAATGIFGPGGSLHTNIVLLGVALALALIGPGTWSIDGLMAGRGKR